MENHILALELALKEALRITRGLYKYKKKPKKAPHAPSSTTINAVAEELYTDEISLNGLADMLRVDFPDLSRAAARSRMQRERNRRKTAASNNVGAEIAPLTTE